MTKSIKEMTNEELFEEYEGLIAGMAYKAQQSRYWVIGRDDALQIGWLTFIKAKEYYGDLEGTEEGSNFDGFIGMRIYGAVLDEARNRTTIRKMINGKVHTIPKPEVYFEDVCDLEKHHYYDDSSLMEPCFEELIKPLKDSRHQQVMRGIYQYEMTTTRVADNMGVSESRVSQIHSEAIKKLQKCHEEYRYAA